MNFKIEILFWVGSRVFQYPFVYSNLLEII